MKRFLKSMAAVAVALLVSGVAAAHPPSGGHRGSTTNINTLSNVANGNGNSVSISNQGSSVFGGFSRGGSTTNTNNLSNVANGNGNSVTISNH